MPRETMPTLEYDVIVIGLGPAGASAAYHLATAGLKVLALERKEPPRFKCCAGGLTAKAFPLLENFDYSASVGSRIMAATVCFRQSESVTADHNVPVGAVVDRAQFDHLLALRAQAAGAQLRTSEPVRGLVLHKGWVQVRTESASYTGRYVVGADGAHGPSSKYLGRTGKPRAMGMEVHVPDTYAIIRDHAERLSIYFGDLVEGYGWIFPHAGGASVGVGIPARQAKNIRGLLEDFLAGLQLPRELARQGCGHPLPVFSPLDALLRRYRKGHILLAGDAACFVDPITGEGIYYALASGKAAAQAIIQAVRTGGHAGRAYTRLLKKDVLDELGVAWKIALPLYAFPERAFRAFCRHDGLREIYFDILAGKCSHAALFGRIRQKGLSVLRAMARRLWQR